MTLKNSTSTQLPVGLRSSIQIREFKDLKIHREAWFRSFLSCTPRFHWITAKYLKIEWMTSALTFKSEEMMIWVKMEYKNDRRISVEFLIKICQIWHYGTDCLFMAWGQNFKNPQFVMKSIFWIQFPLDDIDSLIQTGSGFFLDHMNKEKLFWVFIWEKVSEIENLLIHLNKPDLLFQWESPDVFQGNFCWSSCWFHELIIAKRWADEFYWKLLNVKYWKYLYIFYNFMLKNLLEVYKFFNLLL